MRKLSLEEKLRNEFSSPNFVIEEELSAHFKFRPDLLLKNENTVRAFIVRRTNSIPLDFIDRFSEYAEIEGCIIERYIAFTNKPSDAIITKCTIEKRIAVCFPYKGNIETIQPKGGFELQDIPTVSIPEYEMPHTVIFFSSVEELPERMRGKRITENISARYKKAIFANLVERDKLQKTMTPTELWKEIFASIDKDEYFLGILAEEYSSGVEGEIQRAMNIKSYDNIILLLKNNEQTRIAWRDLLYDIGIRFEARRKTVWYMKYDDIEDFEECLRKEIMELISKKHKENGSTFL